MANSNVYSRGDCGEGRLQRRGQAWVTGISLFRAQGPTGLEVAICWPPAVQPGGCQLKTLSSSARRGSLCSRSSSARYLSGASSLCLGGRGHEARPRTALHTSQHASPALPSPVEPLLQDADAEHGLRAVAQVQVLVLRGQGHLVLLVPLLLLLQLLGLLRGRKMSRRGDKGWLSPRLPSHCHQAAPRMVALLSLPTKSERQRWGAQRCPGWKCWGQVQSCCAPREVRAGSRQPRGSGQGADVCRASSFPLLLGELCVRSKREGARVPTQQTWVKAWLWSCATHPPVCPICLPSVHPSIQ